MQVVGCCQLSLNSLFHTNILEVIRYILTSIFTPENLHLLVGFFLNQCPEFYEHWECLFFLPCEEDPTLPWEIINKYNMVLMSSIGVGWERSTDNKVDTFQDCMCFSLSITKCGFHILPQGTSLAYIILLKGSFRKARGYLFHNLQGVMMKMSKSSMPKFTNIATLHFLCLTN